MSRIAKIRLAHNKELEKQCKANNVDFASLQKLLDDAKTKKLLRRTALMQQIIDKEIDKAIENEN